MSKSKRKAPPPNEDLNIAAEPEATYQASSSYPGLAFIDDEKVPSISSFLGKRNMPQSFESISNKSQYISLIRNGVAMKTLERIMDATGITSSEIAAIIHTSERTLRRYEPDTLLNPEQSERVVELARLFNKGSEVFGSLSKFKTWMNTKVLALGNIQPKQLLDTSLGIEILQEELGRIEHGIFA